MVIAAYVLHTQVASVCPIDSVSVGRVSDRSTWKFVAAASATPAQLAAAQNVLDTFDLAGAIATAQSNAASYPANANFQDLVNRLRSVSATQIETYVQNNVTDLPSAKVLLTKILLILGTLV
jgi:hypothetical protein